MNDPGSETLEEALDRGNAGKIRLRSRTAVGRLENKGQRRTVAPGTAIKDFAFHDRRVELGFHGVFSRHRRRVYIGTEAETAVSRQPRSAQTRAVWPRVLRRRP